MLSHWAARYELDRSTPSLGLAAHDLALRVLTPATLLWGAIVGLGFLIIGPLDGLPEEDTWSAEMEDERTPTWNAITSVWSHAGNTEIVIGVTLMAIALAWWRTRAWWYAVVPGIAVSVQATVFVLATWVTGRERPDVEQLDPAPPTSSYPSGHAGASTALCLTLLLMGHRIRTPWLRTLVTVVCGIVPLLVTFARFYRGMHHLSDCVVGVANGIACAALAWGYLRRADRVPTTTVTS